jgi:hypothetical protein
MAAFTQDVAKATKAQDPGEQQKMQRMLEQRAATASKQYGSAGTAPMMQAPTATMADTQKAEDTFSAADYARRAKVAPQSYALAQKVDTQGQDLQSKVRDALLGRQNLQQDTATTIRQQNEKYGLDAETMNQQFSSQMGQANFQHFKTIADQTDAMSDAYNKGILGYQMIDLANKNMLKMSDIEKYFTLITTDINNRIKELSAMTQPQRDMFIQQMNSAGSNIAAILSGLTGAAQTGAKMYQDYQKDKT